MIIIPPNHYCVVSNPVVKVDGVVQFDKYGQAKLNHADLEVRLVQEPFPLYPGEALDVKVSKLRFPVQCKIK